VVVVVLRAWVGVDIKARDDANMAALCFIDEEGMVIFIVCAQDVYFFIKSGVRVKLFRLFLLQCN